MFKEMTDGNMHTKHPRKTWWTVSKTW